MLQPHAPPIFQAALQPRAPAAAPQRCSAWLSPDSQLRVCLEWLNLISSLYSFLYSVALAAGMLVSLPYWLFQMARHGKYSKGLAERLGRLSPRLRLPGKDEAVIWVHAVSVGEVVAVAG